MVRAKGDTNEVLRTRNNLREGGWGYPAKKGSGAKARAKYAKYNTK